MCWRSIRIGRGVERIGRSEARTHLSAAGCFPRGFCWESALLAQPCVLKIQQDLDLSWGGQWSKRGSCCTLLPNPSEQGVFLSLAPPGYTGVRSSSGILGSQTVNTSPLFIFSQPHFNLSIFLSCIIKEL